MMKKRVEKIISITVILSFVIMLLFDVFPRVESINRDIRVALYLLIDFSVSLFFIEGVIRFFLSWKVHEENEEHKGDFFKILKHFFKSLNVVSFCDIAVFVIVIAGFFCGRIELYGLRIITLALMLKQNFKKRKFIDIEEFIKYFHKDDADDPDNNQSDDKNRFLRYLVYVNLAFFILMTFEHVRNTQSLVGIWFIATFFSAYSALFYAWDIKLRIKKQKTNFIKSKSNIADVVLTLIALLSVFDILINLCSIILNSELLRDIINESVFLTERGSAYSRFALIIRPFAQLRIFSTIPKLKEITRTIVYSFLKILPAFFYFTVLFIIYAAVGHMLFKDAGQYFTDFSVAIRSLFRIMTFESWGVLMEDTVGSGKADEIVVNIYYYSFIVFVSYIMWSVVQGLIVSSVQETERKNAENKARKEKVEKVSKKVLLERLDKLNSQMRQISSEISDLKSEIQKRMD